MNGKKEFSSNSIQPNNYEHDIDSTALFIFENNIWYSLKLCKLLNINSISKATSRTTTSAAISLPTSSAKMPATYQRTY
jgi:hypothetical protein